jgi:hypothetical protein
MESEELRPIVLHVLKNFPADTSLQILTVTYAVEDFCVKKGIYPKHTGKFRGSQEIRMPEEDRVKVRSSRQSVGAIRLGAPYH